MKFSKNKFKKPITGVGTPTIGKSTFSVEITSWNGEKEEVNKFQFSHADLPDSLPEGFKLSGKTEYWWNVKADGSKINDIRPAKGRFFAHCTGFATDQDDDYLVIERKSDFGGYYQGVANIEVLNGTYAGTVYPFYLTLANEDKKGNLSLKFIADDDNNLSPTGDPKKYASVAKVFNFFIACGFGNINIKWNPEFEEDLQVLLAALNKAVLKLDAKFEVEVEGGYPSHFSSLDMEEDDDETSEEDDDAEEIPEPKKKSASKKVEKESSEDEEDSEEDDDDVEDIPVKKKHDFSKLKK